MPKKHEAGPLKVWRSYPFWDSPSSDVGASACGERQLWVGLSDTLMAWSLPRGVLVLLSQVPPVDPKDLPKEARERAERSVEPI